MWFCLKTFQELTCKSELFFFIGEVKFHLSKNSWNQIMSKGCVHQLVFWSVLKVKIWIKKKKKKENNESCFVSLFSKFNFDVGLLAMHGKTGIIWIRGNMVFNAPTVINISTICWMSKICWNRAKSELSVWRYLRQCFSFSFMSRSICFSLQVQHAS